MQQKLLLLILMLGPFIGLFAQQKPVTVYESGTEGFKSFRIPAIIRLKNGGLLAFAEGRVNGAGDFGDVNIVLKESHDHGKTWSALRSVVDYDHLQAGNPAPVLDLLDPQYPQGRIFLFYNTGNNHESEVRKGKGLREVWYISSTDNAATWSEPVNITAQVHHPNQPNANPAYQAAEDWRSYALTPGHALQMQQEKFRGRIYVIGNHSAGPPQKQFTDYDVHGFYTDDHGQSFHLSQNLQLPGSNESMAAELTDGTLLINARNQKGVPRNRIVALSKNGGQSWDTSYYDQQLIDPVCQGSLLYIALKKNKSALLFCNNDDAKNRDNLTLRLSYDDGKQWQKKLLIAKSSSNYSGDFTAYSDLVQIHRKKIAVLYESENYQRILFLPLSLRSLR